MTHKTKSGPVAGISLSCLALAAGLYAAPVLAQTDKSEDKADQNGETVIVVTGIRRSLQDATRLKRNADIVIEAISAEDIGKFPDRNLAESLQRVTGVQITRNKGEGESVSVRGLSPQFTRTLYNGRVLSSPTGGRDFAFTSLATDFISAVEVKKTQTADMIDGGLSATIDVKVARPLDLGKNRFAVTDEGGSILLRQDAKAPFAIGIGEAPL